jgi:hypothetical protein
MRKKFYLITYNATDIDVGRISRRPVFRITQKPDIWQDFLFKTQTGYPANAKAGYRISGRIFCSKLKLDIRLMQKPDTGYLAGFSVQNSNWISG